MTRRSLTVVAVVIASAGWLAAQRGPHALSSPPREARQETRDVAAEHRVLDADIALFERRVREDEESADDRARLAALLLRRSRVAGNFGDVVRAEVEAELSLRLRESRNESTWATLASARLALHDFAGALDASRALVDADSSPGHLALLGEVQLELGRYQEAARSFAAVEPTPTTLSTAPRLARWYEVTGRLSQGVSMARYAARIATARSDLGAEQQAWYAMRAGDLEAKRGRLEVADSLYRAALAFHPGDHRVVAARVRLLGQQGRWREAVAEGEAAVGAHLDPATLGVLREAWIALGDSSQADAYAAAMTASALSQPGPIHRAWGMHLVDHGEQLSEVLRRVRHELRQRRDVYGHDLEGWALHALGRTAEASRAMEQATRLGTEDALIWYHAGVVAAAAGDSALARERLSRAIALNPSFGTAHVSRARALLDSLGAVDATARRAAAIDR